MRKILRMNRVVGPPPPDFFQRLAEVLDELAVGDFDLTSRGEQGDQTWNSVDDQGRLALAFARASSARLRSVKSKTNATPSSVPPSKIAPPTIRGCACHLLDLLPFMGLCDSDCLHLCQGARFALLPFGRGQVGPSHTARDQILTTVSDDAKKGLVGIDDPTVGMPDDDADDVGVDQPPNPCLALLEVAIEAAVLQRDRSFGGEELEDTNPGGGKDVGAEVIFEAKHPE